MSDLVKINCASCGIPFWIEQGLRDTLHKNVSFHCPNGHGQHFTSETHSDKADKFERLYKEESDRTNQYYEQNEALKRRINSYKGVIAKMKKSKVKKK